LKMFSRVACSGLDAKLINNFSHASDVTYLKIPF